MTKKANRLTPAERDDVLRMYEEGYKCEYVAALFGIRRESVSKLAIRRGARQRRPIIRTEKIGAEIQGG